VFGGKIAHLKRRHKVKRLIELVQIDRRQFFFRKLRGVGGFMTILGIWIVWKK
jgi:hypothetical protein